MLLLFFVPIVYNFYADLKNYSNLRIYQVSDEGIGFASDFAPWSAVKSYERFGPEVRKSRKGDEIKLFYSSGVFIKVNGSEYIVYASAKNYKKFINQLGLKGIRCDNA